jgi:hypothetical protein
LGIRLNYEEKLGLLGVSTGTLVFSDFVLEGGIDRIRRTIIDDGNEEIQASGCSVDMRNVWLSAVITGSAGAGFGFKAGCAGGIVAGPIGAGTGCVGGAVMGGASGFISGAVMSATAELLGSCFR